MEIAILCQYEYDENGNLLKAEYFYEELMQNDETCSYEAEYKVAGIVSSETISSEAMVRKIEKEDIAPVGYSPTGAKLFYVCLCGT